MTLTTQKMLNTTNKKFYYLASRMSSVCRHTVYAVTHCRPDHDVCIVVLLSQNNESGFPLCLSCEVCELCCSDCMGHCAANCINTGFVFIVSGRRGTGEATSVNDDSEASGGTGSGDGGEAAGTEQDPGAGSSECKHSLHLTQTNHFILIFLIFIPRTSSVFLPSRTVQR